MKKSVFHPSIPTWPFLLLSFFLILSACNYNSSPGSSPRGEERLKAYDQHRKMQANSEYADKQWTFFGPRWMSGRVTDVAVPEENNNTIYAAAASGGVWKSYDQGKKWKPIFEDAASTSIGDIAIAPSDTSIVWVATGEANIFRSSMAGTGIYN